MERGGGDDGDGEKDHQLGDIPAKEAHLHRGFPAVCGAAEAVKALPHAGSGSVVVNCSRQYICKISMNNLQMHPCRKRCKEKVPVDIFWSRELTPADSSSDLIGRTMASGSVKVHGALNGPAPQVSCAWNRRSETLAGERQTQKLRAD